MPSQLSQNYAKIVPLLSRKPSKVFCVIILMASSILHLHALKERQPRKADEDVQNTVRYC